MGRPQHVVLAIVVTLIAASSNGAAQVLSCRSGQDAIARGAFSTALSHLTRCLETEGLSMREMAAALHLRAMANAQMAQPLKASEDYRRSLGFRPPEVTWDLLPLGIYLREAGKLDESLEILQQALKLDEDGPGTGPGVSAHFHLGMTLHELGRYAEAIDAYSRGVAKQPGFEGNYLRRAHAYQAAGQRDKARADLEKILEIAKRRGLDLESAPEEYKAMFIEFGMIRKD